MMNKIVPNISCLKSRKCKLKMHTQSLKAIESKHNQTQLLKTIKLISQTYRKTRTNLIFLDNLVL